MRLNLKDNFADHIRWMAQTSTWRKSTENGPEEVVWQHAIFDLPQIETGWAVFAEGQAPEWVMDPSLDEPVPKPQDGRDWRRGFQVDVFSDSALDGVREFATTATGARMGIGVLYDEYEAEAKAHPNMVPVVEYTGSTAERIGKGNTNIPNLRIVDWVDRSIALPLKAGASAPPPARQIPSDGGAESNDLKSYKL